MAGVNGTSVTSITASADGNNAIFTFSDGRPAVSLQLPRGRDGTNGTNGGLPVAPPLVPLPCASPVYIVARL